MTVMPHVLLICPEPIRPLQQGIGIRFRAMSVELSRRCRVTMWTTNHDIDTTGLDSITVRPFPGRDLARELADVQAVILHGHVSERYFDALAQAGVQGPPLVCDLYDPFLVENLQYTECLGTGVYARDRRVLANQLAAGDLLLVSSERQRLFYTGMLMGGGGFDPRTYVNDPSLQRLFAVAPFGVDAAMPRAAAPGWKQVVPGIGRDDHLVLFGGIYDWYDPELLLEAAARLADRHPRLRLVFSRTPNPATTPQARFERTLARAEAAGMAGRTAFFLPWFPYADRGNYLAEVDVAVCLHRPSLETDLSLRTRVLDYLCAGIPVIATTGGDTAAMIEAAGAGVLVPPGDADALGEALDSLVSDPAERARLGVSGRAWVTRERTWPRVLEPLVRFCARPVRRSVPPECSVVIPTHNRVALLGEVVAALEAQQDAPPFDIVIVDDGSSDGTREWLAARRPDALTVITQANRGPAAARNAGLRAARGRIVAFLGDDTVPDRRWLATHVAAHAAANHDPQLAVVGRIEWHARVRVTPFLRHINEQGPQFGFALIAEPHDVPFTFFYTSNVSLHRQTALAECFDERFPAAAWEDIEFAYRLTRRGLRIHYAAAAVVAHDHPTTIDGFLRRQERVGYSAVIFHDRHPELGSMLGLAPDGPPPIEPGWLSTPRLWRARLLDRLGVSTPRDWDAMLRHSYLHGLHRGWRDRRGAGAAP